VGKTAIGWTDETWNPVRGCTQISPGCNHCYAKHQAARIVRMNKGKPCKYDGLVRITRRGEPAWTGRVAFDPETLAVPLGWRTPRRVFVNSMSDLFHESLNNEQIAAVFGVMAAAPRHTFQVLTKRARRMRTWFEWADDDVARSDWMFDTRRPNAAPAVHKVMECLGRQMPPGFTFRENVSDAWPLPNVWLGVSTENQEAADERIPDLLDTPAAIRFLSCEPLLGPITLRCPTCAGSGFSRGGSMMCPDRTSGSVLSWRGRRDAAGKPFPSIHWVIDGCESGPSARPAWPAWFESLEAQCRAAGVAYFHKQQMIGGKLVHDFPGRQEFPHG
jgi:protein gp37